MTEDHQNDQSSWDKDEFGIRDDAIIGRAFLWSLLVFAFIGVVGIGMWLILSGEAEKAPEIIEKKVTAPRSLIADVEAIPEVTFTDVTDKSGLDIPHVSGAEGEKLLPETMGSGVAFVDLDRDGDQDIILASGTWWPHSTSGQSETATVVRFNDGKGHFKEAGPEWEIGQGVYATGLACGDVDGDGFIDVFVAAVGGDRLYRNTGNGFEDVTQMAGVAGDPEEWSSSPAFLDIDADGDLDLLVPHYVKWSRQKDLALHFTLNGTDRAYGPPKQYEGTQPTLWRNNGDGTFDDVSDSSGMVVRNPATGSAVAKSLAVAPVDIDFDGDLDFIIANDTTRNFLYRNDGEGQFEEVGVEAGVAYDVRGNATGAMGIDVGHYRNDASLGIGIGNFANEMTSFYVRESADGWFTDEAVVEGIGAPTRPQLSFGLLLFDYDLDGRLDLFQTNGHLEEEIHEVQASQQYRQPAQLFWNAGDVSGGCFRMVPPEAGGDLATPIVGRGAAFADIDADGDLDVVVTQPGLPPVLLRNEQSLGHHWLRVRLIDETSTNRDAV
ncbi:MAG: VCBS repeat-containing protein, partial [Phycisphaerales bacterium]|nr:VCBS repeat-containing protein [Phycisphaerales bacterium]